MKFRKGNRIAYTQDHAYHEGVPHGVDFKATRFGRRKNLWQLRACGYGCMDEHTPKCYGNGSLILVRPNAKLRKRLEEAEEE